jgi:hypothetical protein
VLFESFVVRTMGCKKDANYKSMLHGEEPVKLLADELYI